MSCSQCYAKDSLSSEAEGLDLNLMQLLPRLPRPVQRQKLVRAFLALAPGEAVQEMTFDFGARACVDLRDPASRYLFLHRSFWPEFAQLVAAFMRRGGVMFDVGANFGLCSFGVVPLVPSVQVSFHLFEANPAIIPVLRRSTALQPYGQFEIIHGCVTDHPGTSPFFFPLTDWANGMVGDTSVPASMGRIGTPVPNVVLDDHMAKHGIETVTFLKMDIEGWEAFGLRGAEHALAEGRIETLFVEIIESTLARAGFTPNDILVMMERWGFDAYFCRLWNSPQSDYQHAWFFAPVNGTQVQFARVPKSMPDDFHGDVLFVHRDAAIAAQIRTGAEGR
jgi:FkbM family methyltransferase